jgi:PAS domain S-box-containing protein
MRREGVGIAMRWLILVAAVVSGSAVAAAAQAPPPDSLTVAVLSNWPPYFTLDASGSPEGFAVETVEGVARRAGFTLRYRVFDEFGDAVAALERGDVDVIPNMGVVEGRDLLFTAPVDAFGVSLFVRESAVGTRTAHDVRGRVAVVETNVGIELVADQPDLRPVVFRDVGSALFGLLSADVDALAYPAPVIRALARDAGVLDRIVELEPTLREVRRAIAVSRGDEALRDRLDAALAEYLETAEFRETYTRWHAPPSPFWTVQRVAVVGIVLLALLLLAAGVWRFLALRRFAAALKARERTFRTLAEGLSECVMLVSARDQSIQYVNGRCRAVLGREPDTMVDRLLTGWIPVSGPARATDTQDLELERADGTRFPAEVSVGPRLSGTDPSSYLVTVKDVTEERRAEQRLRFQARLLDLIGEAVIATDTEGRVTYWNRYAEKLYGWEREEAIDRSILDLTIPESSADAAAAILDTVRRGEVWTGELTVVRRDGSTFPARVTNAPILDEQGTLEGIVGASADLTEPKELERKFLQAQKLESVGRLAGGVAHDFNNLLTVIRSQTDLILLDIDGEDPIRPEIEQIQSAADRAAQLTNQLLAFSRGQVLQPRVVRICDVVDRMSGLLERVIEENVTIQMDLAWDLPPVTIDPIQLEQALLNLAINARDAMPEGGTLRLLTGTQEVDESAAERYEVEPGTYCLIRVSDTGIGMDEETRKRIFEPFFSTKAERGGTGLGLAMAYGFVRQSDGYVEVESSPGHGTAFTLYFPTVAAEVEDVGEDRNRVTTVTDLEGTLLVVEDNDSVRRVVVKVLGRVGMDVLEAESVEEALQQLRHGTRIDAVLTDIVLPGRSGRHLVDRVRESHPHVATIVMSGYTADSPGHPGTLPADVSFLPKPFTPAELADTVRRALGQR